MSPGSAAARLVEPVTDDPAAKTVLPQETRIRKPPAAAPVVVRKAKPGELICGACGEPNAPTRRFCRRCGESLAEAVVASRPWWRRLLPRRRTKVLAAGSRPNRPNDGRGRKLARSLLFRGRAAVGVVILVFGVLAGFYPPLRTAVVNQVQGVRDKVSGAAESTLSPIRPAVVTGTPAGANPPGAAFDTFSNTSWQPVWNETRPPRLTVRLDRPVALRKVIVRSGDQKNFAGRSRPATLVFSYSNEKSDTISLRDTPEPQELPLANGVGVGQLTVTVANVYPAEGGRQVALTEIELFGLG